MAGPDDGPDLGLLDELVGMGFDAPPEPFEIVEEPAPLEPPPRWWSAQVGEDNDVPPAGSDHAATGSEGLFARPRPATAAEPDPSASADPEPGPGGAPDPVDAVQFVPLDASLIDLTEPDPIDAEAVAAEIKRYSDWADRMRSKRQRNQAHIRGVEFVSLDEPAHWSADTVIGRTGLHDVGDPSVAPEPTQVTEALGALGLEPGASPDEVALAYRRLAKLHHPDRWASADEAERHEHSEAMMRVNAAYSALRREPSR